MDGFYIIRVPTFVLLPSSSATTKGTTLPRTISRITRKRLYRRLPKRSFSGSFWFGQSSPRKASSPSRRRRLKLRLKDSVRSSPTTNKPSPYKSPSPSPSPSCISTPVRPISKSARQELLSHPLGTSRSFPSISSEDNHKNFYSAEQINVSTPLSLGDSPSTENRELFNGGQGVKRRLFYSNSEPTTTARFSKYSEKQLDDKTIDARLFKKILVGSKAVRNDKLASIYTARLKGDDYHVKIGYTTKTPEQRAVEMSFPANGLRICNEDDLETGSQSMFRYSFLAEQIIHLELYNSRRILNLYKPQTEWFEKDIDIAHKVCRKWRNWFKYSQPYDQNGKLKSFWVQRLERIQTHDPYDPDKHGNLHERWCKVLQPSLLEVYYYRLCSSFEIIVKSIRHSYPLLVALVFYFIWCNIPAWLQFLTAILMVLGAFFFALSVKPTQEREVVRRYIV